MPDLRPGVRVALDWGAARIGVAACDRDGILSFPVETIATAQRPLERVSALVAEYEPMEVLIGLPVALSGREEQAASAMRTVAAEVAAVVPVPVRLVDERLTSATAHRGLAAAGRSSRQRRGIIDQAAAVAILEGALESERRTGEAPGEVVSHPEAGSPTTGSEAPPMPQATQPTLRETP